jgi:hypothetical protein
MVVLAVVAVACLAAVLLAAPTSWLSLSKPPPPPATDLQRSSMRRMSPSKPPETKSEARILERWDRRRAAAYSHGDVAALRRLYAPGSQAGAGDVRILRSYTARGLVVTGMRMRLLSVEAVHDSRHRLVLRVRDRLSTATATSRVDRSVHRQLPTDHRSTHVVTLVHDATDQPWQVSSVR